MDLLWYTLGGLVVASLVRWWQPRLSLGAAAGYLLLAGGFHGGALSSSALQVPTDIPYVYRPWSDLAPAPVHPRNPLLFDVVSQMVPFRALVRERLLHLQAPLWTHEIGCGQPLLGNAQSAPFAPLHLLAIGLPPLRALTLAAAWQTLLALLLVHALLRALGASEAGAALGAVGYGLSSYLVTWAYYPIGMAAAWIPGVLLGIVALHGKERGALTGLVACGVGLALSGHPESLVNAAIAAILAVAALLAPGRRFAVAAAVGGTLSRARFLGRLAFATLLTGLFAAPALLPFLEVLPESERWGELERQGGRFPLPRWEPSQLRVLVDPLAFGSPRDGNWKTTRGSSYGALCTTWTGLVPLALAVGGAVSGRRRWLLMTAALAAGAAFGAKPLTPLLALPGLDAVPPARLRLLTTLAVALAAGLALDEVVSRRAGRWAAAASLLAAAAALALLPPPASVWQRAWWVAALAGGAACLAALLVPRGHRWFPWVAVAATLVDLVLVGARYNPLVPGSLDLAPPAALRPLLVARHGEPFRVIGMAGDLLPNLPSLYGLWDPRSYDPTHPAATRQVLAAAWGSRRTLMTLLDAPAIAVGSRRQDARARPMLDYLGVRYMLVRPAGRLPHPWRRAWLAPGGRVWENPAALPLFFLPARVEPAADLGMAVRRSGANRDFRAEAVVEGLPRPLEQRGEAWVRHVEPNGFALEVASPTGGVTVSSVTFVRGWRIAVDGHPVGALRVNGGFVGFRIPPGRHRVRLEYRPAGWTWGLLLAAVGALLAVAATVTGARRRQA